MPPAAARRPYRHRSVVVVFLLAFILSGFFAWGRLPVELPPGREASRLVVVAAAPGLSAPVIEEYLTRPLERLLADTAGVSAMDSVTGTGGVRIELTLERRRDAEAVQRDVETRLNEAATFWPASLEAPVVTLSDTGLNAAEFILTSRTHDALALRDWVEAGFAKPLREQPGVGAVDIEGGAVREILVTPDQRRLAGHGLSFEDLLRAIRKNPEVDLRATPSARRKSSRREPLQSGNLAAVAALPVVLPGGESVPLSGVASLTLEQKASPDAPRVDDAAAVRVVVKRQSRAPLSQVAQMVRAQVDWMRANRLFPNGIELHSSMTPLDELRRPLRAMAYAFAAGFVLVLVAVYLFFGNGRRVLLFGVIVMVALQAVVIVMAVSGVLPDVFMLGGLALGAGLFGGSVLLMFEHANRPASRAPPPVIAASAILLAALAPAWFFGGEWMASYRGLVAAFVSAWLLAALLAWWLVPLFDARRQRRAGGPWRRTMRRVMAGWQRFNDAAQRRLTRHVVPASLVMAAIIALSANVLFMMAREGPELSDAPEQEIVLQLRGPDGTDLAAVADDIVQRLSSMAGWYGVTHSARATEEQWMLRLDEERVRDLGVDIAMAGKALAIATTGIAAGSFRDADHRYNVRLLLPPTELAGIAEGKILLLGELEQRPAVLLRDVGELERASAPARMRRHNGMPEIEIIAMPGGDRVSARKKLDALFGELHLPTGYQLVSGRADEATWSEGGPPTLVVSLLLVFVALSLLQRSWLAALMTILAAGVTLIVTGAVLVLSGLPLSPPLWLGALLLLGIVAGRAAAFVPGRQVFRPLLALTVTAILGMVLLIWVNGGFPALPVLAIVLTAGLAISLPVTLLLNPLLSRW